jgi:two-component system, chemotaxis family, chemotaxis protein CheY
MAWLVSERSVEGRILVVDDEESIRKTVGLSLTKAGYDVREAEDGGKAIEILNSGDNPMMVDVIICDIRMPKIDGVEAIAYFRTQYPSTPVIVLTGYPDPDLSTCLLKDGVVEYLVKPVERQKLIGTVKNAMEKRRISFYP